MPGIYSTSRPAIMHAAYTLEPEVEEEVAVEEEGELAIS